MIAAHTRIAVTGSTGRLGGRVARRLSELGVDHRLVVRDPAKAPALPGTHIATCDYGDDAAARTALSGVDTVFMVSAAESPDRVPQHLTFIDAAVVAQADIADAAVAVLTSDGAYDGRTLHLTGPAALTMDEIASILSDHLGRAVCYIPETIEEAYASRAVYGAPPWQVDA